MADMPWSVRLFNEAAKRRKLRQQALENKIRSLKPEDRQKVRAYLSVNSGDEVFIRQLLGSGHEGNR
ncbi:MAG: hypothetical protein ACXW2I_05650 [Burkholderiales bacterium]